MQPSSYHFLPLAPLFFLGLILIFGVAIALIQIGVLQYAYEKMGVRREHVFAVLVLSLVGSYVNIPVAELPPEPVHSGLVVTHFGVRYLIPEVEEWRRTVVAVNVGGAVIPTVLSIYLIIKNRLYRKGPLGVAMVALVVYFLATPVRGVGIAVPTFTPPILAALVALLLSRRQAAPLAYIAGSLGTLIGADLMNLGEIAGLGAPVASIGGAGTFDGIFLAGILAVLLA